MMGVRFKLLVQYVLTFYLGTLAVRIVRRAHRLKDGRARQMAISKHPTSYGAPNISVGDALYGTIYGDEEEQPYAALLSAELQADFGRLLGMMLYAWFSLVSNKNFTESLLKHDPYHSGSSLLM